MIAPGYRGLPSKLLSTRVWWAILNFTGHPDCRSAFYKTQAPLFLKLPLLKNMHSMKDEIPFEDTSDTHEPLPDQSIFDEVSSLGGGLMTLIFEIDLLLVDARRVLLLAQPSIEGRIDLRWWKARKGGDREPFVFEWSSFSNGRWRARRLAGPGLVNYLKRSGPFATGYKEAKAALSQIEKLMQARRDLLMTIGNARQSLRNKMNGARHLLAKSGLVLDATLPLATEVKAIREQHYLDKLE